MPCMRVRWAPHWASFSIIHLTCCLLVQGALDANTYPSPIAAVVAVDAQNLFRSACHAGDLAADLLAFSTSFDTSPGLNGTEWTLTASLPPCNWTGIICAADFDLSGRFQIALANRRLGGGFLLADHCCVARSSTT